MYYSVQSRHFDNYLDNRKTAYLALWRYTSCLIGEQTANLKAKSDNARRENPGPPYDCPVFWASETERVFGAKTNYFCDRGKRRNSAGAGRVFGAPRARKTPSSLSSLYKESRTRQRPNPIMDSLGLREVLPVRQERRTQPAPRQTRRAIEEATRHRSRMGASVRRARVRSFVGGRMKTPLEPVLHNQDERARNGVVPESWMGLLSGAHARGFWCPAGRKDPRELVLFASCVRSRQRRNRNRGPAWACRARVRLLVSGRMKTPGLNRRELEPPSGKLI